MFRFLFLTLFPVVLGLHDIDVSEECRDSHETLKYDDAMYEERYELYNGTYWEISVCDYQDGKRDCTWDYTPYLEAEEEICTKVRGFYA